MPSPTERGFDAGFSRSVAYQLIIEGIAVKPTRVNSDLTGVPVVCTGFFPEAVTIQIAGSIHMRLPISGELNEETIKYAPKLEDGWIPLTSRPTDTYDVYLARVLDVFGEIERFGMTFYSNVAREHMLIDVPESSGVRNISTLDNSMRQERREEMRRRIGRMAGQFMQGRVSQNSFYSSVMRNIGQTFDLF